MAIAVSFKEIPEPNFDKCCVWQDEPILESYMI